MPGILLELSQKLAVMAYALDEEVLPLVRRAEASADICGDYMVQVRDGMVELIADLREMARALRDLEAETDDQTAQRLSKEVRTALWGIVEQLNSAAQHIGEVRDDASCTDDQPPPSKAAHFPTADEVLPEEAA
jgi:hypothetical protein